ncbi:MAG: farnesyl-diphosphate synthase [Candidatus Desulfovibrio kirbyi]|jgi:geranylgeranyl diphosphate synthase type II|uniref:Farnesyl-diphosphate synthase n=1 Tax=Candidatus Desulfovibrio kirbyi TaxID=2696086 RepID=A0A6L2R5F7_9BACT|nr:polyprenyl synthetase family protein [Desulfovibrio sp.]GFH62682.1 MAG: farnesyl-diphosphate synthase [Candidatus Desulfovibrio kirbyi]
MMTSAQMKEILQARASAVENCLAVCLDDRAVPKRLNDAMLYSLLAGGKRLRPVLCLACAALCGCDGSPVLPFAAAIEMVHTYSLIHDDLPAMDNDDLRRGMPSSHKKFGEATAILAGDALLTDAFALMCRTRCKPESVLKAVAEFALAAGASGMAGGQLLDMQYTDLGAISEEELRRMYSLKTGAILRASCVCGALLADADAAAVTRVSRYGSFLGVAFQVADDILDVVADTESLGKPVGSDIAKGKMTYPALIGLDKSREYAKNQADAAIAALKGFSGQEADFLVALAEYTVIRAV